MNNGKFFASAISKPEASSLNNVINGAALGCIVAQTAMTPPQLDPNYPVAERKNNNDIADKRVPADVYAAQIGLSTR